jgi:site-specific DNA recombinase
LPRRDVGGHERPRAEWIEVPVPALVSEEMFALAQEQLEKNRRHSPRRTVEPSLLQGMLVCEQCGYGLYRTSTHTSKQKLNYYRCIGSNGYRRLNGPVCTNRPIRQDYLDQFVWSEMIRLLEDPGLIQTEIDRRWETARNADPLRRREEELRREQVRVEKSSERLVTAYQEGLLTLTQLRNGCRHCRNKRRPSNRNYNFWRWRQWTKQSTYNWQRAWQDFAASCGYELRRWISQCDSRFCDCS